VPRPALVRHSLGLAFSQYLSRVLLLLRAAASAAALGPAGFGAWNALNLILDYGTHASLGALQGLDLGLPPLVARSESERARRMMSGAWAAVILGGAFFALVVVVLLLNGRAAMLGAWGFGAPALMLVAAGFQLAIQYHVSALRAHGDFDAVIGAQNLQAVVGGGIGLALVWSWGVWALLWGWIAGSVAALVRLRRSRWPVPLWPGALSQGLGAMRLGAPVFLLFGLSQVLRSLDRIAFVRWAPAESLGQYSLGLMAAGLVLYLPESAASVLVPRIAAAAEGARDPERTRSEVIQTHRVLGLVLPFCVGLGMIWAAPLTFWLLPAFGGGLEALYRLAVGALMLSSATIPAYYLLGSGQAKPLVVAVAAVTALAAVLIFGTAARDPTPAAIALAAAVGYALFALVSILLAARRLFASAQKRWRFAAFGLVPAVAAAALALAACHVGPPTAAAAGLRSVVFAVAYLPLAAWLGRGLGLIALVREWWGSVRSAG
jgi:O-antigen/teichoic acid export membrane protein